MLRAGKHYFATKVEHIIVILPCSSTQNRHTGGQVRPCRVYDRLVCLRSMLHATVQIFGYWQGCPYRVVVGDLVEPLRTEGVQRAREVQEGLVLGPREVRSLPVKMSFL